MAVPTPYHSKATTYYPHTTDPLNSCTLTPSEQNLGSAMADPDMSPRHFHRCSLNATTWKQPWRAFWVVFLNLCFRLLPAKCLSWTAFSTTCPRRHSASTHSACAKNILMCHGQKNAHREWDNEKWKLSRPSYSDAFLYNFHNAAQEEKQLITNSLAVWNDDLQRKQEQISEWKDSFDRNGLADFCPPMNVGMNCLMVGDGSTIFDRRQTKVVRRDDQLPWEEEPGADVTSLQVVVPSLDQASAETTASLQWVTQLRPQIEQSLSPSMSVLDPNRPASIYDCIVDQGLLGSVLALEESSTRQQVVQELLWEAATALREHGIYVLVTPEMSPQTRHLLEEASHEAGLEWQFSLDGISDETQVVSVARRFNNGAMPKVGRLSRSRYQP